MLLNQLRFMHHPVRARPIQPVEQVLELLAFRDEVLEALQQQLTRLLLLAQERRVSSGILAGVDN